MPIIDKIQLSGTVYTIGSENSGVTSGEVQTMIDNSLSGYVYTADNGKQDIYGSKTFIGEKRISFTQGTSSNKPGFTIYGVRDAEGNASQLGTFELNPTAITESNTTFPLLSLGHYRSGNRRASVQTYIGFRQYDYDKSAAYHLLAPLPQNAKTPFSLTTSFQNFYMPLGIKVDNSTMVKADSGGVMDISEYIGGSSITIDPTLDSGSTNPVENRVIYNKIDEVEQVTARALNELNDAVSGKQDTLISGTNIKTINNESILGSGNITIQGGGGGVDTGTVQTMIDESISGKTDTSAFTAHTGDSTIHVTSSEKQTWNAKSNFSGSYNDLTDKPTIPTSASQLTNDSGYITSSALDDYTTTATTSALNNVVTAHTANTSIHVSAEQIAAWNAKSDFSGSYNDLTNKLSAGTNITIVDNVISAEGGGGKAIEAGRGITVTTGETADTVSFNLPISAGTGFNSIIEGSNTFAGGQYSHSEGLSTSATTVCSHAEGSRTIATNANEHASGTYNVSNKANTTWGDSGNTLFSVGNGTSNSARHNAFEIRQNGDIYLNDGTNDVKLQDTIAATAANTTALGGLSLVKLSQAEYDALATKDNSTLYVIVN